MYLNGRHNKQKKKQANNKIDRQLNLSIDLNEIYVFYF
jgi:hypothetical protein